MHLVNFSAKKKASNGVSTDIKIGAPAHPTPHANTTAVNGNNNERRKTVPTLIVSRKDIIMNSYYKIGRELMEYCNFEEAFLAFCKGEESGDAKCIYGKIAVFAKSKKDFSVFIPQLKQSFASILNKAEENDPDACFIIGRCYEMGLTVDRDLDQAVFFYDKAAKKNDTDAMFNIGCILMSLGKCDEAMAKYFVPASKLGNASAIKAVEHYKSHGKQL